MKSFLLAMLLVGCGGQVSDERPFDVQTDAATCPSAWERHSYVQGERVSLDVVTSSGLSLGSSSLIYMCVSPVCEWPGVTPGAFQQVWMFDGRCNP